MGLCSPFTTNISITKTRYILSVSAHTNASYLGHLLRLACVPSNSKFQLILDAKHEISCSVLAAEEGRLLSYSRIYQMEEPDLGGSISF